MTHHRKKYKRSLCISGSNERGVSILAPLRGATVGLLILAAVGMFQSTHPCGVRPYRLRHHDDCHGFQSTHPCGVRPTPYGVPVTRPGFQSTHPCGVRRGGSGHRSRCAEGFNPRTPAGCDPIRDHWLEPPCCFNPRTPAGCDSGFNGEEYQNIQFQSTHPCGVRRATSRFLFAKF